MIWKVLHIIIFFVCFISICIAQQASSYLYPLYETTSGKESVFAKYHVYRYNEMKDTIITIYDKHKKFQITSDEKICVQIGVFNVEKLMENGLLPIRNDNKKKGRWRKKEEKNVKHYILAINENCIKSKNLKPEIGNHAIYENADTLNNNKEKKHHATLCFKPINTGSASIEIGFDIVESSVDRNQWKCKFPLKFEYEELRVNSIVPPKIIPEEKIKEIPPVESPKPEPIKKDPYDTINKTDINALCNYFQTSKDPRAKNDISRIDREKWKQTKNTIESYNSYLKLLPIECSSYALMYADSAYNKITYLQTSAEWNRIKSSGNEEAIIDFYNRHRNYKEKVISLIQKKFPNINIIRDTIKENDKEKHIIRGKNTVNPKYKDLSLNKGILIDDSNWPDSMVIEIKEAGRYEILIRDEFGRETTLTFDYNFKIDEVNQDRKQYTMEIKGGQPPFTTIISRDSTEISAVKGLKLDKIQLKKDEKISENKIYDIIVRDAGGYKAVSAEKLTIEKSLSVQAIQAIILITALIITLFLLFILLRRKRRRDNPAYAV